MEGPELLIGIFSCNAKISSIVPAGGDRFPTFLSLAMDKKICETINYIFSKVKVTVPILLPKTRSPTLIRRCYVASIVYRYIEAIMDTCGLFRNYYSFGWIQLDTILKLTKDYNGINIDDEKLVVSQKNYKH